jgi:hypothetical protein
MPNRRQCWRPAAGFPTSTPVAEWPGEALNGLPRQPVRLGREVSDAKVDDDADAVSGYSAPGPRAWLRARFVA